MASKKYVNGIIGENNKDSDSSAEEKPIIEWKNKGKRKGNKKLKISFPQGHKDTKAVFSTRDKTTIPLHQSQTQMPRKSVISSPDMSDDDFESFTADPIVSEIRGPPLVRAKEYIRLHKLWKSAKKENKQHDSQR